MFEEEKGFDILIFSMCLSSCNLVCYFGMVVSLVLKGPNLFFQQL